MIALVYPRFLQSVGFLQSRISPQIGIDPPQGIELLLEPDGGQSRNCATSSNLKRLTLCRKLPENHTAATLDTVSGVRPTECVKRSQEPHKKCTAI